MHVYHGTSAEWAKKFESEGIDGHLLHRRTIHGPQDQEPGLFVTPVLAVARRFGLYIIEIEVAESDLVIPSTLRQAGASLEQSLTNKLEPQALLPKRIEPAQVKIVESQPEGYLSNPFEERL